MNKTLQFIIPLILLTGILITSCQKQNDFAPQINTLQSQVSALQKRCDSLSTALASSNSSILNLSAEVLTLTNNENGQKLSLDSIRTQIAAILTSIATLNTKVTDADAQITSLNNQLTQTNANVSATNAQIVVIDVQITTLNNQYASLLAQLNLILAELNAPGSLSSGLVAYYPFSGNANDLSGNGYNGTIFGGVTPIADRFGVANSAYHFNGVAGSHIQTSYQGIIGNASRSISLWVRVKLNTPPINNTDILYWGSPTNGNTNSGIYAIDMSTLGTNSTFIAVNNGGANGGTYYAGYAYSNLADGNWHNYIIVFDNAAGSTISSVKIYVDGIFYANNVFYGTYSTLNTVSGLPLDIGENVPPDKSTVFGGDLDDIRIYNRVLTQSEITYLATH